MRLLEILTRESRARDAPFVVIGGHAVIAHGYARQTFDLDLLVRDRDRAAWLEMLAALDYRVYHADEVFVQLSPPSETLWPVDLMLVSDATFEGIGADARDADFGSVTARIPSLEHLLALKLHVLKDARPPREVKDLADVVQLVVANRLDARADAFRRLCVKYGNPTLYERILDALGRP